MDNSEIDNIDLITHRAKAFEYLFDSVVVTDLEGIIQDWNTGSQVLFGYSKSEAIGQSVSMLHVPQDSDHLTEQVMSGLAKEGKWTGEIRMLHKDGYIGWIESMCVPLYDVHHTLIGALGVNRDITSRIEETERLAHLAHYDTLTEIPNRYLVLDRVERLIAHSQRYQKESRFALVFIDVDKFKTINDTKGHLFGDKVLIETAKRLKQAIRNSDTAARLGGDEFLILLGEVTNKNDVAKKVASLACALSEQFVIDGAAFDVSYSFGCAIYPDDGKTADILLKLADNAMYQAKQQKNKG